MTPESIASPRFRPVSTKSPGPSQIQDLLGRPHHYPGEPELRSGCHARTRRGNRDPHRIGRSASPRNSQLHAGPGGDGAQHHFTTAQRPRPVRPLGLTPGVTFGANFGNGGGKDVGRNFFKSDFNVGGGRSGSQEILLDGAPNTTPDINRGIINPPVDSVQEFKVQANSYDAEFGRTSGGVINMVTKAGGNSYHGVAYDFERHSNLDANDFFNNRAGRPLTSFQRHQFGGDLGGPILKNKWFL